MSTLSIKFISKDGGAELRYKGDHMQIVSPYQYLACFHCGYWLSPYPKSSSATISIRLYKAISRVFAAEHRKCERMPEGRESYIILKREWDDFMERNKEQREEWERDHNTKWAPKDWGAIYDEWINLPYEEKESEKDDTRQPGSVE